MITHLEENILTKSGVWQKDKEEINNLLLSQNNHNLPLINNKTNKNIEDEEDIYLDEIEDLNRYCDGIMEMKEFINESYEEYFGTDNTEDSNILNTNSNNDGDVSGMYCFYGISNKYNKI